MVAGLGWSAPAGALSPGDVDCTAGLEGPLTIAVRDVPPYVIVGDGEPTGFSIELWQLVGARLGIDTEYLVVDRVSDILDAVADGRADAGVAAISMTADREGSFDFSVPIESTGLRLLVRDEHPSGLAQAFRAFTHSTALQLLLILFGLAFVAGASIWLVERNRNPDFPSHPRGLIDGMWWAVVTMATVGYGDHVPRSSKGRVLSVVWILIGIVVIAQFTAVITSELTVEELTSDVTSLEQLADQQIVTVEGTAAADLLVTMGVRPRTVSDVDELVSAVASGSVEAGVYDGGILEHRSQIDDRVRVVGAPLTHDQYAIALRDGDPRLECIDRSLLDVIEDGTWLRLHDAWFS
jgi:polar amino acid transport system substrate-binding protein